jgi:hypothetical protein
VVTNNQPAANPSNIGVYRNEEVTSSKTKEEPAAPKPPKGHYLDPVLNSLGLLLLLLVSV